MNPTTIGPFQIERELGRGGMGVVYLARDTRLDRMVAIKALPDHLVDDPDRLARFQREAKTLASVNHPSIASIYGLEAHEKHQYLVLEYVEGETLAEVLKRGPIPVDEALVIAKQVAEALEAAHEKGVVHRDIKPGNVIITPDGGAKVLDFGLARTAEGSPTTSSVGVNTDSPTLTTPHHPVHSPTIPGAIMGTAGYMSPEQARGKPVDKRTDIWSFGVVLYEMLVGSNPFQGETATDSIGAVLHKDIDLGRLPAETPPHVRRVLDRCLERDRNHRWRDIGDVRLELLGGRDGLPEADAGASATGRSALLRLAAVAAVALGIGALGSWMLSRNTLVDRPAPQRLRLDLVPPEATSFATHSGPMALSPDGEKLAFIATDAHGRSLLHVRDLQTGDVRALTGTNGARSPFWSPDGASLGYVAGSNLFTIFVDDGRPVVLAEGKADGTGGAWKNDGTILFCASGWLPLHRVSSTGGPVDIGFDHGPDRIGDWVLWPELLPDNRHFLYAVQDTGGGASGVFVGDLSTGDSRRILDHSSNVHYVDTGHIVYWRDQSLFVRSFDIDTLTIGSHETRIAQNVLARDWPPHGLFTASRNGRIVYCERGAEEAEADFVWYDLATGEVEPLGIEGILWNPRLSRDGARLAYDSTTNRTSGDVWVRDLARGADVRFTQTPSDDSWPIWSLDDSELFFYVTPDLVRAPSSGVGRQTLVYKSPYPKTTNDLTPDGRYLLFHEEEAARSRMRMIDLETGDVLDCLGSPSGWGARVAPNGRWAVYASEVQGVDNIYMSSFPDGALRFAISSDGGRRPIWSRDGSKILYEDEQAVYSVSVEFRDDGPPVIGEPVVILPFAERRKYVTDRGFDISLDGTRLLLIRSKAGREKQRLTVLEHALTPARVDHP